MCVGRIDLQTCGCFDEVKIFPCPVNDVNKCGGIGAMITNHVNGFCTECAERKKNNAARLQRIIAESREKGAPRHVTSQDQSTSTVCLTRADAVVMPPTGPVRSLSESIVDLDGETAVPAAAGKAKKENEATEDSFSHLDEVFGDVDMGEEVEQPKSRRSKSGKIFLCCFSGGK